MNDTSLTLLRRAGEGDPAAWERLDALYRPLVRNWLIGRQVHPQEADDLSQDVLLSVLRGLGRFQHAGMVGAFRGWLRTITVNRAREFWRTSQARVRTAHGDAFARAVEELADPASPMAAAWDREHDAYLVRRLLELVAEEFEPPTIRAFQLAVFGGRTGAEVAAEVGLSVPAVYAAKSRVLARLRAEAEGLLD